MQRQRVLLIDDTDAFLIVLNSILKNDYDTLVAKKGAEGLKIAKLAVPDLILLDVLMPEMSGLEVLEALKADETTNAIPVVLISGMTDPEDEQRGLQLGAAGYIKKPFKDFEVKIKVDEILKPT